MVDYQAHNKVWYHYYWNRTQVVYIKIQSIKKIGDLLHFSDMMKKSEQNAWHIEFTFSDIIHPSQTGFLHGRYIGDNIRQVPETIEYYEISGTLGLVFIADFEKAFNKVRLEFIYKCLEYFKFGEYLIKWVKVMYSNPRFKIVNKRLLLIKF